MITQERIDACIDACEGIDTEDLLAGSVSIIHKMHDEAAKRVLDQRDELLAALKASHVLAVSHATYYKFHHRLSDISPSHAATLEKSSSAIARAEGRELNIDKSSTEKTLKVSFDNKTNKLLDDLIRELKMVNDLLSAGDIK